MLTAPRSLQHRRSYPLLAALISLLLLGCLLLFTSCTSRAEQVEDPFALFRPAVKERMQKDFDLMANAPRYYLDVKFDEKNNELRGSGVIEVANYSKEPWNHLIFRLYPSLQHYAGSMTIQSATLDGNPTNYTYQDDNTSLRIVLPRPLMPDGRTVLRLTWRLSTPTWVDDTAVYVLFGRSQGIYTLPLFYPALGVYVSGPTIGSGYWWTDEGTVRGDATFNVASLFAVTATISADLTPVTSGTLITSTLLPGGQTRHMWVTGPSREFLLHLSSQFSSASEETYGTRVTSYWLPGEEPAGREALRVAVGSLRIYSDLFGDYPFRDLRVAPTPTNFRGMEYPQVALLGVDLYDNMRSNLELILAHEIAHQWWYQIVHNDPVNSPWLDEGLAEYSMRLYREKLVGSDSGDLLQYQRWQVPLKNLKDRGRDALVDQPVESFINGTQYETIVYGKGALFYAQLREALGERPFFRFLQTYLNGHRYQIVNEDEFQAALHVLGKPEIMRLYRDWIGVEQK